MAKVKRVLPLEGETWDLSLGAVQHTSRWGIIARAKGSTLRYYPGCSWEKPRRGRGPTEEEEEPGTTWPDPTPLAIRVAIWVGTRPFCGSPPPGTCTSGPSAFATIILTHGVFSGGQLLDADAVCRRVQPPDGSPDVCWDPDFGAIVSITAWFRYPWGTCEYQRNSLAFIGGDPAVVASRMGSPGGLTLVGVWNRGVPPREAVPWWLYPDEYGQVMPDCPYEE
jgi:hypothetical protein